MNRWTPEGDDLYRYLVALYGFDPLAERDLRADLEAVEVAS